MHSVSQVGIVMVAAEEGREFISDNREEGVTSQIGMKQ